MIDAEGKTISLNSTSATKSISRKSLFEIISYLQEPQEGVDAAYGNREFARLDTDDRDGKQTATIWFAPTTKDSIAIAAAQADGDLNEVENIYGRAANRASAIVDFDEILEGLDRSFGDA